MTLKTLEWWVILLKVLKVNMTVEWKGDFDKNWWLSSDAIPFQFLPYPHNTWQWVGLNCKFMYFSMGSLWTSVIRVMPRLPPGKVKWREKEMNVRPKPCAVPGMADRHHWEAKLMGEVPILGYVSERLMVDDPHTELWLFRVIPDGCNQMLWHKCATSAECKPIRIAASAIMDSWKGHTVPSSELFQKGDLWSEFERWLWFWITTELWEWH